MEKNEYKTHVIRVGYSEDDWKTLKGKVGNSTSRSIADYIRKVTLGRPVVMYYRNKSFDAFIDECIELRNEMHAIFEKLPANSPLAEQLVSIYEKIFDNIQIVTDNASKNNHGKIHLGDPPLP